jgi:single-stranded-DNA-specific exonuclease
MKKYIKKKLSDYPTINGFGKVESALFIENGFITEEQIGKNFPDLYTSSWLKKFISSELSSIGGHKKFVEFIVNNKNKHYCIIGDYDADGIMATTIMKLALDTFGVKKCDYIIPNRLEDGYGIRTKHIDRALELGAEVIVTVDNGITAHDVVNYAKEKKLFVIITDHHIPDSDKLPGADIIINPHLTDEKFEHICGAFVAFKLANRLLDHNNKEHEFVLKDMAMFAAVATVSDVMPLYGENRSLLKYVLDNTNFIKNKGIWSGRTLKFLSGFGVGRFTKDEEEIITEDTFGFYIGPAINASGRVNGTTEHIVDDIIQSVEYGRFINGYKEINRERQEKTREIFKEHVHGPEPIGFLVIDEKKYDYPIGGLIGLVANRVSDREQKPAIVGTNKDGLIHFSCRSVPGYSLYDGLNRYINTHPGTTVAGGGHDGAIGIRLTDLNEVELLREHFSKDYLEYSTVSEANVFELENEFIDEAFNAHRTLAPFGQRFEKLKLSYTEIFEEYIPEDKLIGVGDYYFKTFIKEEDLPKIGEKVHLIITLSTERLTENYMKVEEIEVIKD